MLSSNQLEKFLSDKLGFENWESKLNGDKFSFVKELVRRYSATMYYENITWGARKPEERSAPTIPDVIKQITETAGGACIHLNYFMKLILDSLGFDTFLASAATKYTPNVPNNHQVVIVRIPTTSSSSESESESSYYMTDMGFGRPIIDLIPLTTVPFIRKAGGFQFQYRLNSKTGLYERILKGGCPLKGKFKDESEEKVDYDFGLSPLKFEDFDKGMGMIFTKPEESFFLNTCLLFRITSLNVEDTDDPELDYEYVCCRGRSITKATRTTRQDTLYDSYIAMLPDILKWFPLLNPDIVRQGLLNYDQQRQDKN